MSKRKANNCQARIDRLYRGRLRRHCVAVVNIDPEGRQGLVNYMTAQNIVPDELSAAAVCDIAHPWVIYMGVFCVDQNGRQYIKPVEIAPQGVYKSDSLAGVIEEHYRALLDTCNPAHVVGSGWIANPAGVSLSEEQAANVFEACGAWTQQREAE